MSDLSWLNPTPHAIAVYASRPLSPVATQHSLPSGRYSLLGPDFHRLDRASFAWRTHSITSSARASSMGGTVRPSALALFNYRLDITDLSSVALFCRPAANARENRCMTCPSLSGSHTPKLSRETIVSWSWMIITRFPSSILKFARIGHLHGVNHMKHQVGHRAESAGPMRPLGDS